MKQITQFRRWLSAQIRDFDDDTPIACERCDSTVDVIREAQKFATELGLPDVVRCCRSVTTPMLSLPTARLVLGQCLAMLPKPDNGMLSLREAAALLGYTEKGLRKIGARKGIDFFQSKPWAPIKFKKEWIESFVDRHSTQKERAVSRPKVKRLTYGV